MWSPPPPPTSLPKPLQLCLKMPPLWQRDNDRFSLASRKRLGHTAGGAASLRVTKTKRPRNQLLNEPLWNFHRGRPSAASATSTASAAARQVPKNERKPVSGAKEGKGEVWCKQATNLYADVDPWMSATQLGNRFAASQFPVQQAQALRRLVSYLLSIGDELVFN